MQFILLKFLLVYIGYLYSLYCCLLTRFAVILLHNVVLLMSTRFVSRCFFCKRQANCDLYTICHMNNPNQYYLWLPTFTYGLNYVLERLSTLLICKVVFIQLFAAFVYCFCSNLQ